MVEEQDARLGVVVGRAHDLVPQIACLELAIDPEAVLALVGAAFLDVGAGLGAMNQFDIAVGLDRLHEAVGDAHRDVEVGEVALVLGADEVLDVGVVAAQHAHLGAAPAAGRLHRFAGTVEDPHVRHRTGGAGLRALDVGADRADGREVVTDTAAAAHGFGGLQQGGVDAGTAVDDFGDRVAHRLHEAIDQRRAQVRAGGRIDAAGGHEAVLLGIEETFLPVGALVFGLHRSQCASDTVAHVMDAALVALGVLLDQYLAGNFLRQRQAHLLNGYDVSRDRRVRCHLVVRWLLVGRKQGADAMAGKNIPGRQTLEVRFFDR